MGAKMIHSIIQIYPLLKAHSGLDRLGQVSAETIRRYTQDCQGK